MTAPVDTLRKENMEYCCPNIEKLVAFVLVPRENLLIRDHLTKCEICSDLVGGINEFKKEKKDLTIEEFYTQLNDMDDTYLSTLKLPETYHVLIDKIVRKLDLPEIIEKRIREIL